MLDFGGEYGSEGRQPCPISTWSQPLDFRPLIHQTVLITPASVETNGEVSRIEIILEGDQIGPLTHIHPSRSATTSPTVNSP